MARLAREIIEIGLYHIVSDTGGRSYYDKKCTSPSVTSPSVRNRYYDPVLNRFITEDPIQDGLNWYAYANNDPVNFVDPLGLDCYIIYDKNAKSGDGTHTMADEAEIRKGQLDDKWSTDVHIIGVSKVSDFIKCWDKTVGYDSNGNEVSIEEVVIIAHGSITGNKNKGTAQSYFYFENGGGAIYAKKGQNTVEDLAVKEIEDLTFSTCNSGNPDVYNLAYAFKQRMTIKGNIVAWDGGTIYNYAKERLEAGGYGGWIKEVKRQPTWYRYVDKNWYGKPLRKRIGYRQISGVKE